MRREISMSRSLFFLSLGFLSLIFADPARAEKRVALVIGISNYQQVPRLANPVRDADAIAGLFKKAGFDVVDEKRDLGIADMRRVVREFSEKSRDADIAVVYYAGHGIEVDGTNYLVPSDAKLVSDFDVEDETVSLDRLLRALDPVKRLRLVILQQHEEKRRQPFDRPRACQDRTGDVQHACRIRDQSRSGCGRRLWREQPIRDSARQIYCRTRSGSAGGLWPGSR
jgi:hypothetical protein